MKKLIVGLFIVVVILIGCVQIDKPAKKCDTARKTVIMCYDGYLDRNEILQWEDMHAQLRVDLANVCDSAKRAKEAGAEKELLVKAAVDSCKAGYIKAYNENKQR